MSGLSCCMQDLCLQQLDSVAALGLSCPRACGILVPRAVCSVAKSSPALCDPKDCSLSSSSVHEISQARILECVAISFSRGSSQPRIKPKSPSLAGRFLTTGPPGKSPALLFENNLCYSTFVCVFHLRYLKTLR